MGFATARGTRFELDGEPIYLSGANTYYLGYSSAAMVDAALDAARAMGLRTMRTWGFLDKPENGFYFQSWDASAGAIVFNDGPTGLEKLDYAVFAAAQRGLKLILPLVNNWMDMGGVDQYVSWLKLPAHNSFFTDCGARLAYKNWATHLLNRKNTYTGLSYKEDPAILAWELANEPRCEGDAGALLAWVGEMSAFVKEMDGNHLVAVGDEGFFNWAGTKDWAYNGREGGDFEAFLGISTVDFGTFHLYPDGFGKTKSWALDWIGDHLAAGARAGKPVILEEYGLKDRAARADAYQSWLGRIYAANGAGDLFWMLADKRDDGTMYPDYDGYTLYQGTAPGCIAAHAARMAGRRGEFEEAGNATG